MKRTHTPGLAHDTPEPEIVAHLFKLYAEKTAKQGAKTFFCKVMPISCRLPA